MKRFGYAIAFLLICSSYARAQTFGYDPCADPNITQHTASFDYSSVDTSHTLVSGVSSEVTHLCSVAVTGGGGTYSLFYGTGGCNYNYVPLTPVSTAVHGQLAHQFGPSLELPSDNDLCISTTGDGSGNALTVSIVYTQE